MINKILIGSLVFLVLLCVPILLGLHKHTQVTHSNTYVYEHLHMTTVGNQAYGNTGNPNNSYNNMVQN